MTVLKVDEWQGKGGHWYVADVHTWTNWRAMADVLGVAHSEFVDFIEQKYDAIVYSYNEEKDFLAFYWDKDSYKMAHQFKLDINRIARKKNFLVEKAF